MLQIKDIRKQYVTGDLVQTALDGVSLTLRDNEFVAILGPSGSGKTTLLNVIGGLDRYDSGDLIINGISTRKYSARDWDSYRNHTIGFVFQSYNLIPHQTVLANVELALTISGISRGERKKRAAKALQDVGLGDQLHKRPNQMSGGQMQRVAIARALVNNPDILLADEPTGALDSETSVQIMELLKEVAKDRLVVMVTHNPELAYEYANRIVRVKDGKLIDDTNPYAVEDTLAPPKHKNMGKASMSWFTALSLSFNNLRTKKARTLLTAFAGSIGIIGIALIMSLSTGFQAYIDQIQEDTLSNYPLTIQSETADMSAAMMAFGSAMAQAAEAEEGVVVEQPMISQMFAQIGDNDLGSFKAHLEANYDSISHTINDVRYSYGIKPLIYREETEDTILQVNPGTLFGAITGNAMMSAYMDSDLFREMIDNVAMLDTQYDVLRGRWPERYDELIIVLQDPSQFSDYMAYTLGLKDPAGLNEMIAKVMRGEEVEAEKLTDPMEWTYDELMSLRFRLVPASGKYRYNEEYNVWEDMSSDKAYMRDQIEDGVPLTIVGIVCAKDGVSSTALSPGVAYTNALTRYVIDQACASDIVTMQQADPAVDVFTGKEFGAEDTETELRFEDMISIDENAISSAFGMNISTDAILQLLNNYMAGFADSIQQSTVPAQTDFNNALLSLAGDMLRSHIAAKGDAGTARLYLMDAEAMVEEYLASGNASAIIQPLVTQYGRPQEEYVTVFRPLLLAMVTGYISENLDTDSVSYTVIPVQEPASLEAPQESVPAETEPAATEPPATTPVETEPAATEPPATTPVETEPAATELPATTPVETEPPATRPPETQPDQTETEPVVTEPLPTEPAQEETEPAESTDPTQSTESPDPTEPSEETQPQEPSVDPMQYFALISADEVDGVVAGFLENSVVKGASGVMATRMSESAIRAAIQYKLSGFTNVIAGYFGNAFYVNEEQLAAAFQFNMSEEDLMRLMNTMSASSKESSAVTNLQALGYADLAEPTMISIYLKDFEGKEEFLAFLDGYNADMEAAGKEDQVISYTDMTGILMSSVSTIINSVTYVLIAFVAVSLIVSSIMIGIITLISVQERTKEIGILRAIGASKRNISQVFNAETFIVGLCSGIIGVGMTLLLNVPINMIIHELTGTTDINAQLPAVSGAVLVMLSMVLTLIGGLIPSRKAAKKDPVIALRSE